MDELDKKIIQNLQENARLPIKDVSARIGLSSFHVAPLFGGLTRFEAMKNLPSCLTGGCRNCLDRNTKRGKTLARFLCQVSSILKFSNVSRDDRFAAQIVYRAIARRGVGGFVRRAVALRYPVTELPGFLSFQFRPRDDRVRKALQD